MDALREILLHCPDRLPIPGFDPPAPAVRIYRNENPNQLKPVVYFPCVVLVVQGAKTARFLGEPHTYDIDNTLTVAAPLPIECQVVRATPAEPYLAACIPVPDETLGELAPLFAASEEAQPLIHAAPPSAEMVDSAARLCRTLQSPLDALALGKNQLKEFLFRTLSSDPQNPLRGCLHQAKSGSESSIGLPALLAKLSGQLDQSLSVREMAGQMSLSESAFHRLFQKQTNTSPIQYFKKLRLHKAYDLLYYQGLTVTEASESVGYTSPTQFSREFKRLYGTSPSSYRYTPADGRK